MPNGVSGPGRLYARLLDALGLLSALILASVALLVTIDVLSRNLWRTTFPWIVEITEYSLPLATLLAVPMLLHRNEHVRLDLLVARLSGRNARRVDLFAEIVGACVSLVLAVYSVRALVDSASRDAMIYKTLVFPEWWLFVPMPLCFGLLTVEFARRFAGVCVRTPGGA